MGRKQSLLYRLKGIKPSLFCWYILRFTGTIKRDDLGKLVYLPSFWLWRLLKKYKEKG